MQIEYWPVDKPIDYPKNARKWSKDAVAKVARSLQDYGFRQPIVVDEAGVIIIGHLRRAAARSAGIAQVPVHVATGLSPEKVRGLRLADNRTSEESSWNLELLAEEMGDLRATGFDLQAAAFNLPEIDALLADPTANAAEDVCPEPPEAPVSVLGDLWRLDPHRVLCGDCRDFGVVERLFGAARANLVVTSPPYAEQREYDPSSGFRPVPPDEYVEWYRDLAANIHSVLADDGSYFLNIKPSCEGTDTHLYVFDLVIAHVRQWGFHFATEFCWERTGVPKSVTQRFKNQFEPVYQFALGRWKMRPDAVRHFSQNVPVAGGAGSGETSWAKKQGGKGDSSVSGSFGAAKKRRNGTSQMISDVQCHSKDAGEYIQPGMAYPGNRLPTFASSHDATGHAAAFPVGLPEFFIRAYTDESDIVFDPFMGSGSTLIAADRNNRIGYGTELSPKYVDVIVQRWQNQTGKQATLEGHGATFEHVKEGRRLGQHDALKEEALEAHSGR